VKGVLVHSLSRIAIVILALAGAQPAAAATKVVAVNAKAVKPLTLSSVQDLDLGTLVLGPGSWANATIGISRAGVFTCASANVTCSGATRTAAYTVSGSNNETVRVTAPNVTLTNQSNPSQTLTLAIDGPVTVTLDNGGKKGTDFSLGGSITVGPATQGGTYTGTLNVTVDY
jgi:hypothetical protein